MRIQLRKMMGPWVRYSQLYEWSRGDGKWHEFPLSLDPADWDYVGSPNGWHDIRAGEIRFSGNNLGTITVRIDGWFFGKRRYSATAEDSASQGKYDVRCGEPIVDEALRSDAECLKRAESIIEFKKEAVITLTEVLVDGDYRYIPGERQRIGVPNSLDEYFRILQVEDRVLGSTWDAVPTLSDEPVMLDYVFRMLKEAQKLLERQL